MSEEHFWTVVAAVGQVAGAFATFLAVLVSLYLARAGRRPHAKLTVGARVIIGGGGPELHIVTFSLANTGDRPIHVRSIGWRTGRFRWGPSWLVRQAAIQLTGGVQAGQDPPYEVQPGAQVSSFCQLADLLDRCRKPGERPFFTRDFPLFGRRAVKVRAFVSTAEGYSFSVKPEKALIRKLADAEREALTLPVGEVAGGAVG